MFFFFQAEDGIRDYKVTGVQTCALPISTANHNVPVRRSVKHQKMPVATTPAIPAQVSPGLERCTPPNASESRIAAGQNPIPCPSVNCTYPRNANSSYSPTTRKNTPQNSPHRTSSPP